MANPTIILGIDVGASGIKAALVNVETGQFVGDRHRIPCPQPSTPALIAETIEELRVHFHWQGPIGIGFPAVVKNGVVHSASNIDKSWIGTNGKAVFEARTGCKVHLLNDADAAGLAEMRFGYGQNQKGAVLLLTIGTGIGSALFYNGNLVPNTEFGHLYMFHGVVAEHYCADSAKKREDLSWDVWAKRFNEYLKMIDFYLQTDLILLGGGSSKQFDLYKQHFGSELLQKLKPCKLLNSAGIVGAAMFALEQEALQAK